MGLHADSGGVSGRSAQGDRQRARFVTDRNAYARDWMRIKRAKDRIPKLEKELAKLRKLVADSERRDILKG